MPRFKTALTLLVCWSSALHAVPKTSDLAGSVGTRETQQFLLRAATRAALEEPATPIGHSNRFAFPIGGRWIQLSDVAPAYDESTGCLAYTCLLRRSTSDEPLSAVTYLLRDAGVPPVTLTDGYAVQERVHFAQPAGLPLLAVIERSFPTHPGIFDAGMITQISAQPRSVWVSDPSRHGWQWGFAKLDNAAFEALVVRSAPQTEKKSEKSVYDGFDLFDTFSQKASVRQALRWDGERFVPFEFPPAGLDKLPDAVWRYGVSN